MPKTRKELNNQLFATNKRLILPYRKMVAFQLLPFVHHDIYQISLDGLLSYELDISVIIKRNKKKHKSKPVGWTKQNRLILPLVTFDVNFQHQFCDAFD